VSALSVHLEGYCELRRALGYKSTRTDARLLGGFVRYLEAAGQATVTVEAALAWAAQAPTAPAGAARLTVLRGFARYLSGFDPACQVPPAGLIRANKVRPAPHIYTPDQLDALLAAAATLTPGVWAATMGTLIGLMAATGIRPEEAYRLRDDHVEVDRALLCVVNSKRGKSRRIPLHASTVEALRFYITARGRCPHSDGALFVNTKGTALTSGDAAPVFRHLLDVASIRPTDRARRARLGNLRHTFAVSTLLDWHHQGADLSCRLPVLSAYLGHNDPHSTYWYLEAVPELMAVVAQQVEQAWQGRP
jgi:integrase/recombinase XerD